MALGLLHFGRAGADENPQLTEASRDRAIGMRSFLISAPRIDNNPWRYGTVAGFEILSRASDEQTKWVTDALQRGAAIEDAILPPDWLPRPAVPYTINIATAKSDLDEFEKLRRRAGRESQGGAARRRRPRGRPPPLTPDRRPASLAPTGAPPPDFGFTPKLGGIHAKA